MQILPTAVAGMQQAESRLEADTTRLARASDPTDSVDLSAEIVNLIQSRNDFALNAKVWKTGDEIQRSTLNILA
jgi:hypothetical protein